MATYCKRPLQGMVNPRNPHGAEYYHCQLLVRATLVAHFYYQKEKNGGTFTGKKKKKHWWHDLKTYKTIYSCKIWAKLDSQNINL